MFFARLGYFVYLVEAVDGQWHWSLEVAGTYICQDGPFSLENAKIEAQSDYDIRIAHARKIIDYGQYVEAD